MKNLTTGNDDSRGPDSFFRVTIPADGDYILRITDHLGRGVCFIEAPQLM